MRDNETFRPTPDPETVQPDPMLEEHPAGPARILATLVAAMALVALALYGMTRPAGQQEIAAATTDTAPAGGGAANSAGGQAQPANAPAQNSQPNPQQPTTTGQGSGEQAGQSKTPPASGGSATSTVGPGAKPAPEAR